MNLHQIANGVITAVNPNQPATIQFSSGYTQGPQGQQIPQYSPPVTISAQVQHLSGDEIKQTDGLSIQGTIRSIYVTGSIEAIVRVKSQGGDLITLADGQVYLTTRVLEQWPDWCNVIATLQDGS